MICGEVSIFGFFHKICFYDIFSELRFEHGPCMLGESLDSYLKPTARCEGFLSTAPLIEVRVYVSILNYGVGLI